jgi:hypothetical protein
LAERLALIGKMQPKHTPALGQVPQARRHKKSAVIRAKNQNEMKKVY